MGGINKLLFPKNSPTMVRVYFDRVSGDEFGSDSYKCTESDNGIFYCLEGQMVSESGGIDESLIGGNASAEGGGETTEDAVAQVINFVSAHQLQKYDMDAKGYMASLKPFMKKVIDYLTEHNPDRVEAFKTDATNAAKRIKGLLKKGEIDLYIGESFNVDGMIGIVEWRDNADGDQRPCLLVWKDMIDVRKV